MAMKKALLLGLGAMIFGGCYSGVEDAGDGGVEDRYGKNCYYSYGSDRGASYTSSSSDKGSDVKETDKGFQLTMKADATSSQPGDMQQVLNQLRHQAGITAPHHIAQTCWEADDIADACKDTCGEQGLAWDDGVVVCDECVVKEDGSLDCGKANESLQAALQVPWSGQEPWFYTDDKAQLNLIMFPPKLEEDYNGELVWVADVEVNGFCFCACTAD